MLVGIYVAEVSSDGLAELLISFELYEIDAVADPDPKSSTFKEDVNLNYFIGNGV